MSSSSSDPNRVTEPYALSIEEAANFCGIGRTKLYELIKKGAIKARKLGRRTILPVADLKEFVESLPLAGRDA